MGVSREPTKVYTPCDTYRGAMRRYLSISEVAERTGLTRNTAKSYSQVPGRLPPPDAMVGRVKGWLPETIDAWWEQRKARRGTLGS